MKLTSVQNYPTARRRWRIHQQHVTMVMSHAEYVLAMWILLSPFIIIGAPIEPTDVISA